MSLPPYSIVGRPHKGAFREVVCLEVRDTTGELKDRQLPRAAAFPPFVLEELHAPNPEQDNEFILSSWTHFKEFEFRRRWVRNCIMKDMLELGYMVQARLVGRYKSGMYRWETGDTCDIKPMRNLGDICEPAEIGVCKL